MPAIMRITPPDRAHALPDTVIVVGATGFVGQNLVRHLKDKVARIVPVSTLGAAVAGIPGIRFADLDEAGIAADAVVVNLAAHRYDRRSFARQQPQIFARNVEITSRVYEFCARCGITEVRLASSSGVYPADVPSGDDAIPLDLAQEPQHGELLYAWSKRIAEVTARLFAASHGIHTIAFRLTNPYGPRDGLDAEAVHVVPALIIRALTTCGPLVLRGNPAARRDFIYVGDICEVFGQSLARRGRSAVYNLGSGESTTIGEVARTVLDLAGSGRGLVVDPSAAPGVASRQVTADRLRADFAIEQLTPLRDGLARTVDWYRDAIRA